MEKIFHLERKTIVKMSVLHNLIYRFNAISGDEEIGQGIPARRYNQKAQDNLGNDEYIHSLQCSDGFTGVYTLQNI